MKDLTFEYSRKKSAIKKRLKEFKEVWKQSEKRIFSELCFCICTPQSKAVQSDKAISRLERSGVLFKGNKRQIRAGLGGVRFPNNKSKYIVEARKLFFKGSVIKIKEKIDPNDVRKTRKWLVKNVKGLGFKEASHFLRNIGLGNNLAILDTHILRNMAKYGVIRGMPASLSEKRYLLHEEKLRRFSKKVNIPLSDLDLLFWSAETGQIFK